MRIAGMGKALAVILLLAIATSGWMTYARTRQPIAPEAASPEADPEDRVVIARKDRGKIIAEKYHAVAVQYPGEVFIRWFKREAVIELWARNDGRRFRLIASYPILASSGLPGPKRREGDRQVPEGIYEVDRFNPQSSFHLSLGLNYPNEADLVHADPTEPGSDIFIHGGDVSTGCAPIGDDRIDELYLAALDARAAGQKRIAVHIFPARMSGPDWEPFAAAEIERQPALTNLWDQLQPAYASFERRRLVPAVEVTKDGVYVVPKP